MRARHFVQLVAFSPQRRSAIRKQQKGDGKHALGSMRRRSDAWAAYNIIEASIKLPFARTIFLVWHYFDTCMIFAHHTIPLVFEFSLHTQRFLLHESTGRAVGDNPTAQKTGQSGDGSPIGPWLSFWEVLPNARRYISLQMS